MDARNNKYVGMLLATVAVFIWAGNFVIARGVNGQIPPITLAFCRWSLATVLMLPIAFNTFKKEDEYVLDKIVSNKTLSSGQMQKIAFMRVLLSDADVLFLESKSL